MVHLQHLNHKGIYDNITDSSSWRYDAGHFDPEVIVNYRIQDVVFKILYFPVKQVFWVKNLVGHPKLELLASNGVAILSCHLASL